MSLKPATRFDLDAALSTLPSPVSRRLIPGCSVKGAKLPETRRTFPFSSYLGKLNLPPLQLAQVVRLPIRRGMCS